MIQIHEQIARELGIRPAQAEAAVRLIDEGNTIPFISRYRKEATGSLNDEQLRALDERLRYLRSLEERKDTVLASIREQGRLTPELEQQIRDADRLVLVEDLYRPFRPKRRTRASIAAEKGLRPLAELIRRQESGGRLAELALEYVQENTRDPSLSVLTKEEALRGAADIIAEEIAETAAYRDAIRRVCRKTGSICSAVRNEEARALDEKGVFEAYYSYEEAFARIPGHRVLALNRGEAEGILKVTLAMPEEVILSALRRDVIRKDEEDTAAVLRDAVSDSFRRLIAPAVERELRTELTESAQDGAIRLFGKNLTQLLMQPPVSGMTVLGWDPAFRTGCKLAVADPTGKILDTAVIYPTAPHHRTEEAARVLKGMIRKYGVEVISLGNGTASRESEQFLCGLIRELQQEEGRHLSYVIVNEAGASVYSASRTGAEEFPEFDVGQRSAASMARRLQDPLSELVKMDPKSIGVGQYQHDMDQKKLGESLDAVIEDCVNRVGADLNTASASLLSYVSGISRAVAANIVSYREEHGRFLSRRELLKVPKLGPRAFEQCAGFLRIRDGSEPLDQTSVHPESYQIAGELLQRLGLALSGISSGGLQGVTSRAEELSLELAGNKAAADPLEALAAALATGVPTLRDILSELEKPGRDPRDEMPRPILRSDVLQMEDLREGMILKGTVRNIVDFGAFVDIGVHQDGLVHISEMSSRFIRSPMEIVSVGDIVTVRVLGVDLRKQRIALSMKNT